MWSYIIDNSRFFLKAEGNLLEQIVTLITHIRDTHDLHDENVSICSMAFHRNIFYDLTLIFPMMKLIPIQDADLARIFRSVIARASEQRRVRNGSTLYVCSDASKSVNNNLCGWAWYSSEVGHKSYNFGVSELHSIVDAEFEGILHAVIDNANTSHSTIHVYCDSQRSVEFVQLILAGQVSDNHTTRKYYGRVSKVKPMANPRLRRLALEVVEIAKTKNIKIQWVRGHQSHRLNMGADYLSRAARVASERQGRLKKTDKDVIAIMSMFP